MDLCVNCNHGLRNILDKNEERKKLVEDMPIERHLIQIFEILLSINLEDFETFDNKLKKIILNFFKNLSSNK